MKRVFAMLFAACLLSGCDRIQKLEQSVDDMQKQIKVVSIESNSTSAMAFSNAFEIFGLQRKIDQMSGESFQNIDLTSGEFSICSTKYGNLAVSCGGVDKYADGSKLKVSIGNILNTDLHNVFVYLEYGEVYDAKKWKTFSEWNGELLKKEFKLDTPLIAGQWNMISVTLPHCPPDKLGHFAMRVEPRSISLRRGK